MACEMRNAKCEMQNANHMPCDFCTLHNKAQQGVTTHSTSRSESVYQFPLLRALLLRLLLLLAIPSVAMLIYRSASLSLFLSLCLYLHRFLWFLHGAHSNIDSTRITWTRNDTHNNNYNNNRKPYFEVSGLVPGMGYNVFLIAHNSKGRSNATILQVYTLKDPEKQTGEFRKTQKTREKEGTSNRKT